MLCDAPAMARNDPQVNIRLPAALKVRLDEAAVAAGRSVTAEIVNRLEASFRSPIEVPSVTGLRAQIAAERELAQSTFEMLSRFVDELASPDESTMKAVYPGKDAGKTIEQALTETTQARDMFKQVVDRATVLLSELAIAEAKDEEVDLDAFRQRAYDYGVF